VTIFWDVALYSSVEVEGRFGGMYCLHRQDQTVSQSSMQQKQAAISD
jgi:hypothetical protein